MKSTAERIKEAMELRNLKQVDLVEMTKISKGALSSYISGKYIPKQHNLYLLAKALGVSEAWLTGYDVPMEKNKEGYVYITPDVKQLTIFKNEEIPDVEIEPGLRFYYYDDLEETMKQIENCGDPRLDEILYKISDIPISKLDDLITVLDMFLGETDFNLQIFSDDSDDYKDEVLNELELLKLNQCISYLNDAGKKEMLNRIEELTQIKKYTEDFSVDNSDI